MSSYLIVGYQNSNDQWWISLWWTVFLAFFLLVELNLVELLLETLLFVYLQVHIYDGDIFLRNFPSQFSGWKIFAQKIILIEKTRIVGWYFNDQNSVKAFGSFRPLSHICLKFYNKLTRMENRVKVLKTEVFSRACNHLVWKSRFFLTFDLNLIQFQSW